MATYAELAQMQQAMEDLQKSGGFATIKEMIQEELTANPSLTVSDKNPTITSNPTSKEKPRYWVNTSTGEYFVQTDDTKDLNKWIGQLGTVIEPTFTIQDINPSKLEFHFNMNKVPSQKILDTTSKYYGYVKNGYIRRGIEGRALFFKRNGSMTIQGSNNLPLNKELTISYWVLPLTFHGRQNHLQKDYGSEFAITQEQNGSVSFYHGDTHSTYNGFHTDLKLDKVKWNHILIKRKDLNEVEIKINGVVANISFETHDPKEIDLSNENIIVGNGYAGGYYGYIDDLFLFSRITTDQEDHILYNRRK